MSYDLAVVVPPIPERDAEAWASLDIETAEKGRPPAVFRKLHDRLVARFPCLSSLPADQVDRSVWSSGPLWTSFGKRAAILTLVYSRVKDALPFIFETALSLDLAVFDLSRDQIHRPDGLKGLTLSVEDKPPLQSPTLPQIQDAVDALTPQGGPGFMVLDGPKDYAQAAGGKGAYTVEWRKYSGSKFKHWVAGIPGRPSKKNIAIPTNGFEVTVKENERLSASDAKVILAAFATGKQRPKEFAWRDVTERFG
jgi:hypothetical protein